jgi:ABC-type transport system substrate-binding protein
MAYMSQDRKAALAPAIKAHCAKYGIKATIAVENHMTLVVNIKSGPLDFCQNTYDTQAAKYSHRYPNHTPMIVQTYLQVNPYWAHEQFTGKCKDFIVGLLGLMDIGNHDRSDIQTDYFDVGWYKSVNIGSWKKPYEVIQ